MYVKSVVDFQGMNLICISSCQPVSSQIPFAGTSEKSAGANRLAVVKTNRKLLIVTSA